MSPQTSRALQSTKTLNFLSFSIIFHPTSPLSNQFEKKKGKNLVWNVALLYSRQMLSQALYPSREIPSSSANFRAINTNIYTSYHWSFPLYGHHSPNTFHPWFSLSHKCMRKKYNCGQNSLCTHSAHNILTTVITHIVVDKSTDNAKPHSMC